MTEQVVSSILTLVGLVVLAMTLRRVGFLHEEQGRLFSQLVTQVTLPALIFSSLAQTPLRWQFVVLALVMIVAEVLCLALGWGVGRALKLPRGAMGSTILVAAFGSSSLLGYALICQVFPGNVLALTEAVAVSEMGVGPALFTLGVMVAIYFGSEHVSHRDRVSAALQYFRSPIFYAMVAGIAWSSLGLTTDSPWLQPVFQGIRSLGAANTFCVIFTVGLVLHFEGVRDLVGLAAAVCFLKLILKPVLVWLPSLWLPLTPTEIQVLVLEASMPSALLSVVLAQRYGCDARLASQLVFATSVASLVTALLMFRLLT